MSHHVAVLLLAVTAARPVFGTGFLMQEPWATSGRAEKCLLYTSIHIYIYNVKQYLSSDFTCVVIGRQRWAEELLLF